MKSRDNQSKKPAFTLVELLVVIAVIAILAVLLEPVLHNAEAKAQRMFCQNNLKQLSTAWAVYCGENGGNIPSCVPSHPSINTNLNAWALGNAQTMPQNTAYFGQLDPGVLDPTNPGAITRGTLYPYTQSMKVYRCPLDHRSIAGIAYVRSYSMNNWMNGLSPASWLSGINPTNKVYTKESSLPDPSRLFVFIDEDQESINDAMFVVIIDPGWYMNDIPSRSHRTAYPLSFADGHAESFRIRCGDTLAWNPSLPDPLEISSDGTVNQDIINLREAAYIPW